MVKGFKLELLSWGNGKKRLSYWDSLHGSDVHYILNADGTATHHYYRRAIDGELGDENGDIVVDESVNLVIALRDLLDRLEQEDSNNDS